MQIQHTDPVAGEPMRVMLKLGNTWGHIRIHTSGSVLIDRRFECPDPPCHQAFVVDIPASSRGQQLTIDGRDPAGPQTISATIG